MRPRYVDEHDLQYVSIYVYACLCVCTVSDLFAFVSECLLACVRICACVQVCVCIPQSWSQDPVADNEVEFLQVGSWSVLQHSIAVETALTIIKAFGDLEYITL